MIACTAAASALAVTIKGVLDDEQHWRFGCDGLGGIRQRHASTIEKYTSLPELMAAIYDSGPALDVLLVVRSRVSLLKLPSLSVAIGRAHGPDIAE